MQTRANKFFAENFLIADCKEFFLFNSSSSLLRVWCNPQEKSRKEKSCRNEFLFECFRLEWLFTLLPVMKKFGIRLQSLFPDYSRVDWS
jgi:hypothetical protein